MYGTSFKYSSHEFVFHEVEYTGRAFTGPNFPCPQTLGTKYERGPPPPSKYVLGLYSHITVPSWLILFDSECADARGYTRVSYRTLFFLSVNAHKLFYNADLVLPDVRIPGEVTSVCVRSTAHSKNTNSEIPRGCECDDRIVKCFPHVHVVTEHGGTAQVLVPSAMTTRG